MRTCLKALLVVGFGATQILAAPSHVVAADLAVTPTKRVIHHKRQQVVRDYDGTPIVLRRARPLMIRSYDGTAVALGRPLYEAIPVPLATPARYLNGQPVWPTNRVLYGTWPRALSSRAVLIE